jgi:hypothetical protein
MNKIISKSNFILYKSDTGDVKFNVFIENETIWLTQKMVAELFDVEAHTVNYHIQEIYKNLELAENSTYRKIRVVQKEGLRDVERDLDFYNLDMIISVGYRVNSNRATQFRIWATQTLKEFIIKGFVLDDERLKQGISFFDKDYFKELLQRVKSIRASERRIYQQITDIFAECSTDYDQNSNTTKDFFAMVQNKFHYAISGMTAAEIIYTKANNKDENMGLQTWKNAPTGRVLKSDVIIAKNYLSEKEIKKLESTVGAFFDYIENIIENEKTFTMQEFSKSVEAYLSFNKFKILEGKGKVTMSDAEEKAMKEYDIFNKTQKIESDFDKVIKKLKNNNI